MLIGIVVSEYPGHCELAEAEAGGYSDWRPERGCFPSEQRRWDALENCKVLAMLALVK
jgi:hypothetical protein